jgi:hypothetical protein
MWLLYRLWPARPATQTSPPASAADAAQRRPVFKRPLRVGRPRMSAPWQKVAPLPRRRSH